MEAHCIALELKYQNQALKSGQHGQVLNDESNKSKIKKEIDVLETINIELEHKVANFSKENETLKKHYKDLYDFIKITRSRTIERTTSLLANNSNLKAQIQEKVFAIAALKNDLRKLKGNSIDTKFAKTSVLGKPVLQPLRNQLVVRQPNVFKHERPPISNDMVHNHYLDEAKKKTREKDRNSKPSVRSTNHSSRSLPMSKSICVTMPAMPKADHTKSRSTSINVPKEQSLDVSAGILWNVNKDNLRTMVSDQNSSGPAPECQTMALNHDSLSPAIQRQSNVPQADRTVTTSNELDFLFSLMFDELLNGSSKVVSKSSAISAADAPNQRQQYTNPLNNHITPSPTCQIPTLAPTVISSENINQAETYAENDQVADDEFINIFSTP
nr:hypothetical protein [Tanacetum cinerariifolium]